MAQVVWEYSPLAVLDGLHLGRSDKGLDVYLAKAMILGDSESLCND